MTTIRQKSFGMLLRGFNALARLAVLLLLSFSFAQIAHANIFNDANVSGTYQSAPVISGNSTVSIPVVASAPAIELRKSSTFNDESGDGFAQLGETISYSFTVQNTGNVTLTNAVVTDPTVTIIGGPIASLAPGATDSTTFTATYTLVAADLLALMVTNSATVTATPPSGPDVSDVSDSQNPSDDTGADDDVTVTPFSVPIDAVDDDFSATPVNGLAGGTTATVYTNDTLNGAGFAAAAVTPSIAADGGITGVTINSADGTLVVPSGIAAGTYTVTYQICETANLSNCDTADVAVVVSAAPIVANDDDFSASPVNGLVGGATATVYNNDTLDGSAFAPAAVTPSITANGGIAGLAIDANGLLTIPAGTAAATYTVTYQICEVLNPTNCDTADVTVVINAAPIVANDDDFSASPVNGFVGGATATVYNNDTLDGAAFAPAAVTPSITANGGIAGLTISASGTLAIPAGTVAATYTATYQICEVLNPTNCDTAGVTVVVSAAPIVANDDDFSASPVNGGAGGNTATVYSNDTLNGVAFAPAAVSPTIISNGGIAGLIINASGTLAIPAGTAAATYTVTYQICEVLNPTNCDTADVTVVVNAATIVANDDDFSASPVNGLAGGSTATVYTNDTLNGAGFAPAAVSPAITSDGGLTGVTINASGTLTIPAGTAAATYTVTYRICETLNLTNCDTANVTVVVNAATINAVIDDFSASPVNGLAGGNTATVYTNDTLNGAAFAPAAVTPSITANGGLTGVTINASGTLTIPVGTAAATYTVTYQICEVLNPTNCDTANVTVVVNAATINAVNDDFSASPVSGFAGGTTATVYANDTLNGAAFAPAAVTPSITSNGGIAGLTINPTDGTLDIPAGTAAATYTVTYQICEVLNPTNCDPGDVTVVVDAASIVANADDFSVSPVNGLAGGTTATVYTNDTLNGAVFAPAAVTPSITSNGGIAGLTINASGTLTIPAGTAAATYTVTYQICEVLNPANCDTANVTVVVNAATIVANDDDFSASPVNGLAGGTTATVYTNDTLNGAAFAAASITPTIIADGGITGLTINASGTLTVPSGIAAATYTATYQICEVLNPTNCDTADVTVVVGAAAIDAVIDDFSASPINGLAGGTTATVFINDTLNGGAFLPAAVTPSIISIGGITGLVINANGTLTIPSGIAAATYTVTYRICEVLNPTNCDQADVTVVVAAAAINAVIDDFSASPINGLTGGVTATVFTNDTLNAAAFAAAAVTPTIVSDGGIAGLTINASGTLNIPAGIAAGTYPLVAYRICEVLNPTNCDTATATVVVSAAAIVANDDDFSAAPVNGVLGGTTATVYSNDLLNGAAFIAADVTPAITANGGIAGLTISALDGSLAIPAGTAPGPYTVTYRICESLNLTNCDTATVAVVVDPNPTVTGTVYYDTDGNGIYGGADLDAGAGYIVELRDSGGAVVASTTTNGAGAFSLSAAPGAGYSLMFRRSDNQALGTITGLTLVGGVTVIDQNQPIDPSGIVYNSVTRAPVQNVVVTITEAGGTQLPNACLVDPTQQNQTTAADGAYRFDILPGADPACPVAETEYRISIVNPAGYLPGVSTTMPAQAGSLDVSTCAVLPAACQVVASAAPPASPAVGFYYVSLLIALNDANVVNNHIAIDPIIAPVTGFTKTALVKQARRGERVPYEIAVTGTGLALARVIDIIPPGFDYVAGSATVNGVAQEPTIAGRNLTFDGLVPIAGDITIQLTLVVTLAVAPGPHVNTAQLIDPATDLLVGAARAIVTILAEHVFDCGDVIGKVFNDQNRNRSQDEGEPGLAGVRLVTVKGVLITTDKHGRFHVACADIPDADIGSNFILKLDTRTLPTGFKMTTANPRVVRLTAGKLSKMNFGASITRLVRFDMTEEAFVPGATGLKPQWLKAIDKLMDVLATDKSSLRLTYLAKTKDKKLAARRIAAVEKLVSSRWTEQGGGYELPIESRVTGAK